MHVLLVGGELEENLGLRYLASTLERAGHSVDIVGLDQPSDAARVIAAAPAAQLVGLSMSFQRRAIEFAELAELLREAGYRGHITCGGHFPTFAYQEVLERYDAIDTVVRHEGEPTLPELCVALERGAVGPDELAQIQGIAYRQADGTVVATEPRPLVADLDALPSPRRNAEPQVHMGIPAAFVLGSRGCYGHCTFCCIQSFVRDAGGPRYRQRSATSLADEIAELRQTHGARMFVFHDDDFLTRDHERDLRRVTALRDALRARQVDDIALVLKIRPDDVDEAVFDVLEDIGLLRVYLGVEAGSTQGLRTLARGVDIEANRRGLAFLRERDIYTCFNMLIFDPETTIDSLRESLQLLADHPEVPMNFCRAEVYAGTPLRRMLAKQERLRGNVFGWDYDIADPAAERVFRIFAEVFMDRNFRADGLMNSTIGLGYHLHLLRHFFPKAFTAELRTVAEDVIRRVNLDSVEWMRHIVDFAASSRSTDPEAFEAYTRRTTEEVTRAGLALEKEVAELTAILTHAAREGRPQPFPLWRSVAAATLALSPLACDPAPIPADPAPPMMDPAPPPTTQDADVPPATTASADDAGAGATTTATTTDVLKGDPAPPPTTTFDIPIADPAPMPTPIGPPKDPAPPPMPHKDPAPAPYLDKKK